MVYFPLFGCRCRVWIAEQFLIRPNYSALRQLHSRKPKSHRTAAKAEQSKALRQLHEMSPWPAVQALLIASAPLQNFRECFRELCCKLCPVVAEKRKTRGEKNVKTRLTVCPCSTGIQKSLLLHWSCPTALHPGVSHLQLDKVWCHSTLTSLLEPAILISEWCSPPFSYLPQFLNLLLDHGTDTS